MKIVTITSYLKIIKCTGVVKELCKCNVINLVYIYVHIMSICTKKYSYDKPQIIALDSS